MKRTLDGTELTDATTVVVGGTGNVGFFLVDGYLRAGARVIVPTRTEDKFSRLLTRLDKQHHGAVTPLYGDIGSPEGAADIARQVREYGAPVDAVAASTGDLAPEPVHVPSRIRRFQEHHRDAVVPALPCS